MSPPDARRGPATGPRSDQLTAKRADDLEDTAAPLAVIDGACVVVLDAELGGVRDERREVADR